MPAFSDPHTSSSLPALRLAIVGRPNVGKSSLLNMLAGDKVSIVDPTAGTTRDRVAVLVDLEPPAELVGQHAARGEDRPSPITVEVTDTGGFGVYVADGRRFNEVGADLTNLTKDIEFQISQAVAGADLVLLVIDAQAGVTPQDELVGRLVRERVLGAERPKDRPQPRIVVVANKTDGPRWEAHAYEAAALGFGEPMCVSAKNNYFRRDLLDRLYTEAAELRPQEAYRPEQPSARREQEIAENPRIAIIGKRNAGKSSLVNALAGERRVIVSEIAGTTRDAVDVQIEEKPDADRPARTYTLIDTAGLRKKKSFADRIEHFAFDRAKRAIDRSAAAVLLVDATEPISQVDQQLAQLLRKAYKPTVIVVNKWDLVEGTRGKEGKTVTPALYEEYLRKELKGLTFAPISFISAQQGTNLRETMDVVFELIAQAGQRIGTGQLNRIVRKILETRGPSSKLGTFARVFYCAQVAVHPPTIVLVVNISRLFTANYQKFLLNRLRETLPFEEVPIKLIVKDRRRATFEELQAGAAANAALEAGEDFDAPPTRAEEDAALLASMPDDPDAYFDDELGADIEVDDEFKDSPDDEDESDFDDDEAMLDEDEDDETR